MENQDYESAIMDSILKNRETALLLENCPAKIEAGGMLDIIMATKREQVRKLHPYAITPPKTESGRWQTTYRDSNNKRISIKAQTENELLDKLVKIYFSNQHFDKLTFYGLYQEWLAYKKTVVNSQNTIKRHEQHYRKYFETSLLHERRIKYLDELTLESECNRIIRDFKMSRKEWGNVKGILNGMFDFAVRKHYLDTSPMNNVTISVKFRQVVKKTGKTETYNTEELAQLNNYLDGMYAETNDSVFLAVKLNFMLGLRVGELVALKASDIENDMIHVVREEIRDQITNTYEVVEHTKTNTDRFVALVSKSKKILDMLDSHGEYLFMRGSERITSRQVAYVLEKYAERNSLKVKSTHKMRKTYASRLNACGIPLDYIRESLGHSNLNTTLGYIYNPLTTEETQNLLEKAL